MVGGIRQGIRLLDAWQGLEFQVALQRIELQHKSAPHQVYTNTAAESILVSQIGEKDQHRDSHVKSLLATEAHAAVHPALGDRQGALHGKLSLI